MYFSYLYSFGGKYERNEQRVRQWFRGTTNMTIDHSGTLLWSEMLAPAVADLKVACRMDSDDLAE
jgi:hypothetical protein